MSSAILWIILPILVGVALLLYRRQDAFPLFAAAGFCLILSWAAWQLPIDVVLQLGPFSVEIAPSFVMFGRSFTLAEAQAPWLAFIYLMEALWILGAHLAKPSQLFIPLSLICVGVLVAALAVEPFLYAALLLAMAAMLLIPLLTSAGERGAGVLRFLKFQIFAVPFILFTGWILSGVDASPGDLNLVIRGGLLLAVGFALLLALFPFHSWLPLLAKESHPYVFGFLAFFLPSVGLVFALGFFDRYGWLRASGFAYPLLLIAGGLTVFLGGLWAAGERHPGRMLGYATMVCTGFGLQALGLGGAQSAQVFFALLLPQAFAIWSWATSLSLLSVPIAPNTKSEDPGSRAISHPLATTVWLVAIFSLAGLPLLGSFPGRLALLDGVAAASPWAAAGALIGSLGLLTGGIRNLIATLANSQNKKRRWVEEVEPPVDKEPSDADNPYVWVFAALAVLAILGFGLLPQVFLSAVPGLAAMFSQLSP